MNTPNPAPHAPSAPHADRIDREAALRRPCEGCGAEAGKPCMPFSICEAE